MELRYGMCVLLMVMQVENFRPSGSTDDVIMIIGYITVLRLKKLERQK